MKHTKLSIIFAGAVGLLTAPFAAAIPVLYYDIGDDGTLDGTITDQGAGDSALGTFGAIVGVFSGGGFSILSTAATNPAIGSAGNPQLASTALQFTGTGIIAIYFTEDGFGPTSPGYEAQLSTTSLADGASVTYYSYATTAAFGGVFSGAGSPMTSLSLAAAPDGIGTGGVLPFDGTTSFPFTLTQKVVINQPNGGTTQATAVLQSVPDSGTTLALLGASLLGVGAIRRKMMKR